MRDLLSRIAVNIGSELQTLGELQREILFTVSSLRCSDGLSRFFLILRDVFLEFFSVGVIFPLLKEFFVLQGS